MAFRLRSATILAPLILPTSFVLAQSSPSPTSHPYPTSYDSALCSTLTLLANSTYETLDSSASVSHYNAQTSLCENCWALNFQLCCTLTSLSLGSCLNAYGTATLWTFPQTTFNPDAFTTTYTPATDTNIYPCGGYNGMTDSCTHATPTLEDAHIWENDGFQKWATCLCYEDGGNGAWNPQRFDGWDSKCDRFLITGFTAAYASYTSTGGGYTSERCSAAGNFLKRATVTSEVPRETAVDASSGSRAVAGTATGTGGAETSGAKKEDLNGGRTSLAIALGLATVFF